MGPSLLSSRRGLSIAASLAAFVTASCRTSRPDRCLYLCSHRRLSLPQVFISEQKLYTISQLKQHESTGALEVDGSESERDGFTGHPMCKFCKSPFYGDTELYSHMSTEHFTCHICQRKHPGHYEYYRNYDDLEIHFREEHFLCESEACLTKKFVVFQSDTEMKRHTVIEHGGHMSRAKRNAALQIPISFKYRQNEQEHRRGRSYDHHHPEQSSNNRLTMAIQSSLETAFAESRFFESSHGGRPSAEHGEAVQSDEVTSFRELLPISSISEPSSSRSIAAKRHCVQNGLILQDKSFPPLSNFAPPEHSSRNPQAFSQKTSASLGELFPPLSGTKGRSKPKKKSFSQCLAANTITSRANPRAKGTVKILNSALTRPFAKNYDSGSSTSASSHIRLTQNPPKETPSSSPFVKLSSASDHAAPASTSSLQITQTRENCSDTTASLPHAEDFRGANKSLVENIRMSLGMDEDRYLAFKSISAEYYQNLINTSEYLLYVDQLSLSHLVFELAQLCPDAQKENELINAYCASLSSNGLHENSSNAVISKEVLKKAKAKTKISAGKEALADSIRTVKLSGNSGSSDTNAGDLSSKREILTNNKELGDGGVTKNKKTSKFLRTRLGDALEVSLDRGHRQNSPERFREESKNMPADGAGVWGKGGSGYLLESPPQWWYHLESPPLWWYHLVAGYRVIAGEDAVWSHRGFVAWNICGGVSVWEGEE
ncbi:hypothetical protein KSP40_PGU012449 [Platanthera guangdongensis]|uniref:C2H2-type domain-containing protein n=1 Tax=Platanthera guangdongensis TaxID=2320717 RepID=A0ABR2MPA7_9ASPA